VTAAASRWHLAQLNVASLRAPTTDPLLADFMAALDTVNAAADRSPGFVWRLQSDGRNATDIHLFNDPHTIVNLTVWESIEALRAFTYGRDGLHAPVMARRREWFHHMEQPYLALWWVPAGHIPEPAEAVERLEQTGLADMVVFDGPPAFITLVQEMADVADFVLIPIKASMLDLLSTQDAVVITRKAKRPFMVVINDVGQYEAKMVASSRTTLVNAGIPVAETVIRHRPAHIAGMTVGKSGAEVDKGKDKHAAADIDALWRELMASIAKAKKSAAKRQEAVHG
jgi:hypothetical protein